MELLRIGIEASLVLQKSKQLEISQEGFTIKTKYKESDLDPSLSLDDALRAKYEQQKSKN